MNALKGTAYPFKTTFNGKIQSSSGENHIKGCLIQILGTAPGERIMNPEFGSQLNKLVFESWTPSLQGLIRYYVKEAIRKWEKRVQILDVYSQLIESTQPNTIVVHIKYRIISNNIIDNLTYTIKDNST